MNYSTKSTSNNNLRNPNTNNNSFNNNNYANFSFADRKMNASSSKGLIQINKEKSLENSRSYNNDNNKQPKTPIPSKEVSLENALREALAKKFRNVNNTS